MIQFGESQISGTEFFFRVADRLQMDSCLTAVTKEGKSLVLVSPSGELLDHFGAAFIRRLKQNLANTPVEVFMPPDSEVMLERFNKLLSSLAPRCRPIVSPTDYRALFRLAFASAPCLKHLTLPMRSNS